MELDWHHMISIWSAVVLPLLAALAAMCKWLTNLIREMYADNVQAHAALHVAVDVVRERVVALETRTEDC